jgi:hypothetical protein
MDVPYEAIIVQIIISSKRMSCIIMFIYNNQMFAKRSILAGFEASLSFSSRDTVVVVVVVFVDNDGGSVSADNSVSL